MNMFLLLKCSPHALHILSYHLQRQDVVGAVGGAVATVNADLGFALFRIPENRPEGTGLDAVAAADAEVSLQADSTVSARGESVGGADAGAGGVGTGSTDHDDEPTPHPAR
jgi:hypothetical protein